MTVIRSDGVSKFWLYMFVATVSGNINVNLNAKLKWHGNKATVPTRAEKKKKKQPVEYVIHQVRFYANTFKAHCA